MERKSVTELTDHDVRNERFRRDAAIDPRVKPGDPLRCGGLHDGTFAAAATIAWPAHHLHPQLGGNQVEHLGAILADQVQRAATTGALSAIDVDDDLVAWQMSGQRTAIAVGCRDAPPSLRWFRRVLGRVIFGGSLLGVLQNQLQLLEVELLRAGTIAMAQQALDQLPQLLILGLQLRHHFPKHLLQGVRIFRQGREIDLHNMMMTHAVASPPMTPA